MSPKFGDMSFISQRRNDAVSLMSRYRSAAVRRKKSGAKNGRGTSVRRSGPPNK